MYDIILFTDVTDTVFIAKPMGAYKCAYELRKHGFSCLVVDHFSSFSESEIIDLLKSSMNESTLIVGVSNTFLKNTDVEPEEGKPVYYETLGESSFMPQASKGSKLEGVFGKMIKSINHNCKIIVGGSKTHQNYRNKFVSAVFLGMAEDSIVKYAKAVRDGTPTAGYKNIWGITVIKTMSDEGYDFNNSSMVWEYSDVLNTKVLPFEIARGCIFKCKFCAYPMNGKESFDYIRSKELMIRDLQSNYDQFGILSYYIIDDTFNDSEFKLNMMLDVVRSLTFKPIFWAYIRLDLIARNLKTADMLHEIGIRSYFFGIETMHPGAGRAIGKGYSRDKMKKAISYIKEKYPETLLHGSFIVGLPNDSLESNFDTFNQLMSREIQLDSFIFNGLRLYNTDFTTWDSELTLNYSKYGYEKIEETDPERIEINWKNNYVTRDEADRMANEFTMQGRNSDFFKFPGNDAWSLLNYGYSFLEVQQIKYKDADWHSYSNAHLALTNEYKRKLFEFLKS